MDLMISKILLSFKLKMRIKLIKSLHIDHHKTKNNQRNQLIKTLVGVGDNQIIMIMMASMNSTRLKKLNKRVNGRHLDRMITKKRRMKGLKNYKKEQTLVNLRQYLCKLIRNLIRIIKKEQRIKVKSIPYSTYIPKKPRYSKDFSQIRYLKLLR